MGIKKIAHFFEREYITRHHFAWAAPYGIRINKNEFVFSFCFYKRSIQIVIFFKFYSL